MAGGWREFWRQSGYFSALTCSVLAMWALCWWLCEGVFGLQRSDALSISAVIASLVLPVLLVMRPFQPVPPAVSAPEIPPGPPPSEPEAEDRYGEVLCGQLPLEPQGYIPRVQVETSIGEAAESVVIRALTGRRGVGKTVEAATLARTYLARGNAIAWVNAESDEQIQGAFAEVADKFGRWKEGDSVREAAEQGLRELNSMDGPRLIVFDNLTDPALVRDWIPYTPGAVALITTTNPAAKQLGRTIDVDVFSQQEARSYLAERTEQPLNTDADALIAELDALPLALGHAAARMTATGQTYGSYLSDLLAFPVEAALPHNSWDAYPRSVAAAVLLSLAQASANAPEATDLAVRVAILSPTGIPEVFLHGSSDIESFRNAIAGLYATALITRTSDGAVMMHRLTRRVITDHAANLETIAEQSIDWIGECLTYIDPDFAWIHRAKISVVLNQINALAVSTPPSAAVALCKLRIWQQRYLNAIHDIQQGIVVGRDVLAESERTLGPDHPETATSRSHLARSLEMAGQIDEAIRLYTQVVADRERILGPEAPLTLVGRHNLAGALTAAGRLDEALAILERIVADHERTLGTGHQETIASRINLAPLLAAMGRLDEAIEVGTRAVVDSSAAFGRNHPSTLTSRNNLAAILMQAGQFDAAIEIYAEIVDNSGEVLGPDHPQTLSNVNNHAWVLGLAGRTEEAVAMLTQVIIDLENSIGPDHPNTLSSRNNLARMLEVTDRTEEASALYSQVLDDRERILGPDHPDTLASRNNLAGALEAAGRVEEAVTLYSQALADSERVLGTDHPNTLNCRSNRAQALKSAGRLEEALAEQTQVLADRERILGPDHPDTQASRHRLDELSED